MRAPAKEPAIATNVHGNTEGLKPSALRGVRKLADRRVPAGVVVSPELGRRMCELSRQVGRQLGVLVDRQGRVTRVIVGDAHQLFIPDLTRARAGAGRFRGLRLVHTHLRGEPLTRDDLTDLALLRLDAVVAIQARPDGLPGWAELGALDPDAPEGAAEPWFVERVGSIYGWGLDWLEFIGDLERRFRARDAAVRLPGAEACVVIGVTTGDLEEAAESLDELERLAHSAGLQVLDRVLQRRRRFDPRFVVGKGKLAEILVGAMQRGVDVLVFDQELSPGQLRNIAAATDLKVVDRTQLILDIFAQRARSREGKLQVELAQLRYRKPRLAIMPTAMSRLTGGIGGRGPGETRLEINRRRADERETRLARQLRKLGRDRALRRARRSRVGLPQVAIVGYTNAGKSTLLNTLTRSAVDAEDKLFATLDPTSRRMRFPAEREIVLTDTVGFIRNLPEALVEAFRSTLEETREADLLVHVLDASDPRIDTHDSEVRRTLEALGCSDTPRITVLNKVDRIDPDLREVLVRRFRGLAVSAATGEGLDRLIAELDHRIFQERARRSAREAMP
ncbi:MAG: GTPase HflX [Deltaproteobacteria bacterium]|nr:MAG: GTPase HflX [Deltaproteobacteria bacterium]